MNHVQHMLNAMVGPQHGLRAAWLSFVAVYTYTRAHDGAVVSDAGDTISFSRWYCLRAAVQSAWEHLWKR